MKLKKLTVLLSVLGILLLSLRLVANLFFVVVPVWNAWNIADMAISLIAIVALSLNLYRLKGK